MASQDLSLAQLFPVDSVFPIDLPAVAALDPDNLTNTTLPAAARVLRIFADIMRANHLLPVLCELAVISDTAEFRPVKTVEGNHFVSLIDAFSDYVNARDAGIIAASWVNAIALLPKGEARVPPPDTQWPDSSFIVLNANVYNTLSFRRSMRLEDVKKGKNTAAKPIVLPTVKKFGFGADNVENRPADAAQSIITLINNTSRGLSESTRNKLDKCFLVIVPFSRPFLDAGDFSSSYRQAILADEKDGDLLTTYPASTRDPGGCFFGIYHAPGLRSNEVHETERRFFLQVQYLLTLSAFVEARRSLLLYYDYQLRRDWSFLLHSVKHDIMTPKTVIQNRAEKEPEAADLRLAANRLKMLETLASLSSRAIKKRDDQDALMQVESAQQISRTIAATLADGARLAEEDWAYNKKEQLRLRIDFAAVTLPELKHTGLLKDTTAPQPGTDYKWIGDLHKLICHEVNNSAMLHAERVEIGFVLVCCVKWALIVHAGKLRVIFQNDVLNDEGERLGARQLATKRREFKQSTGLGQMRLGLSGSRDLGDLDVALFEQDTECIFQVSVPIGHCKKGKK